MNRNYHHSFLMLHYPKTIHIHKHDSKLSHHKTNNTQLHNNTTLLPETNASSLNDSFNGSRLKR